MTDHQREKIIEQVSSTLVEAGSSFKEDKLNAYKKAIESETNPRAKWVMESIVKNAEAANKNHSPLCDDSGIPHILIDLGPERSLSGELLEAIKEGISEGLKQLPGRPMALMGNDIERIDQSKGISSLSEDVLPSPIQIRTVDEDVIRVHVLMFGGGPAIRGKTGAIFHKHNIDVVKDTIVDWGTESTKLLGCSPVTLAVGIGRSHYEASSLMLQALVDGLYNQQSELEADIVKAINGKNIGPLGLGGQTSVLAAFIKVGPQRASGVRVVSMRPCCCFEPRIASVDLEF